MLNLLGGSEKGSWPMGLNCRRIEMNLGMEWGDVQAPLPRGVARVQVRIRVSDILVSPNRHISDSLRYSVVHYDVECSGVWLLVCSHGQIRLLLG